MKKIVYIALAVIIIVGTIITATIGLNVDIIYKEHQELQVYVGKETDIKEIMTYIEASFKIDLGDYYRTYLAIRERKKDKTSFLTNLINKLLRKMDEDDKL